MPLNNSPTITVQLTKPELDFILAATDFYTGMSKAACSQHNPNLVAYIQSLVALNSSIASKLNIALSDEDY